MNKEVSDARGQIIYKDNKLIQNIIKKTFTMTNREQKILAYILSLIKPNDNVENPKHVYTFDIKLYCMICGINYNNGGNTNDIRSSLSHLTSYKFWIKDKKEKETTEIQWIVTPKIKDYDLTIDVTIPDETFKLLIELKRNFTAYELYQVLGLRYKYSIAIYELLKSYAYKGEDLIKTVEELRDYLGINDNQYKLYNDFKKRILIPSINEINEFTDLAVNWSGIRTGRNFTSIRFNIRIKSRDERLKSFINTKTALDG